MICKIVSLTHYHKLANNYTIASATTNGAPVTMSRLSVAAAFDVKGMFLFDL